MTEQHIIAVILGSILGLLQLLTIFLLGYIIKRIDLVYTRTARHAVVLENHEGRVARMEERMDITPHPTAEEIL